MSATPIGELLRAWRVSRQLSQLQLSSRADVSTRHLSYLETGWSTPTRQMIERLAHHLEVPLRERNQLMLVAGLASTHPERGLDTPELLAVSRALQSLLEAHMPFPALVLDRWWDIVDCSAATDLLRAGCAAHLLEPRMNAVRLTLHPEGLASRIANLGQWRSRLLTQVRARSERDVDLRLRDLAEESAAYPGEGAGRPALSDVVMPLELTIDGATLRFFSISATVESARDVTVDELRIETFYPSDCRRRSRHPRAAVLPGADDHSRRASRRCHRDPDRHSRRRRIGIRHLTRGRGLRRRDRESRREPSGTGRHRPHGNRHGRATSSIGNTHRSACLRRCRGSRRHRSSQQPHLPLDV